MREDYLILVHCRLEMSRLGLEHLVEQLPFRLQLKYADLAEPGITDKLSINPNLIIIYEDEPDGDFGLAQKIKLFAMHTPLMLITPEISDAYHNYLRSVLVDQILVKPFSKEQFKDSVTRLL